MNKIYFFALCLVFASAFWPVKYSIASNCSWMASGDLACGEFLHEREATELNPVARSYKPSGLYVPDAPIVMPNSSTILDNGIEFDLSNAINEPPQEINDLIDDMVADIAEPCQQIADEISAEVDRLMKKAKKRYPIRLQKRAKYLEQLVQNSPVINSKKEQIENSQGGC